MSDSKEKLMRTIFEACEHMTDEQQTKFLDFLYRLVVKKEKFTKEGIIRMAEEV